jgi:hypothetical protein
LSEKYFEKFEQIRYANTTVRNLTQRTVFLSTVYNDPVFYYPYDIQQGERPDMVADRYYSDQYMSWLLYMSNNIIDPYHDWYVDQTTFEEFIVKKYGSLANALTKIKYYRNNWYSDPTPTITAASYESLDPALRKFYEPVPVNDVIVNSPLEYTRKREDWVIRTNAVARYATANGAGFAAAEVVDVVFGPSSQGTGQVAFANTTAVILENLSGVVTTGTISGSSYMKGRESLTNTAFTSAVLVANNIPAAESGYWSPVTLYDYETEINERNKSILVLKSEYSSGAARQLRDLLK